MIDIFNIPILHYFLKFIFVTGALFYLIYTFIMFRQIQVMKKTLITSFSSGVSLLGLLNLILAAFVVFSFWTTL